MKYCYNCGEKLELKHLEHEGMIPFCNKCNKFIFPIFNAAVSMIITDKDEKNVLLIKQYNTSFYRFVAGYINKGESAEEAVYREILEEVGLKPIKIKPLKTSYFEKSNTLMCNYLAICDDINVVTNYEIDEYKWFPIEKTKEALKDAKLAYEFFCYYMDNR